MRTLQRSLLTIAALSMFSSPTVLAQDRSEQGRSRTGTESTSGAGSSSRSGSAQSSSTSQGSTSQGSSSAQGSSTAQGTQGSGATSTGTQQGRSGAQGTAQQGQQGTSHQGTAQRTREQEGQAGGMAQRKQERASGMMASDKSLSLEQRKQIQQRLRSDGYYDGEIDGVMGQTTKDAVRQFQQANRLPATGQINQQTLAALGVRGAGKEAQGAEQGQGARATREAGQKTARLSQQETVSLTDLDKGQIEALQRKLQKYGVYQGEIDGKASEKTRSALQAFYRQQAQLVSNGKLLSESASALTGDQSIQRVRGEDEDEKSEESAEHQKRQHQKQKEQSQGQNQGQTRGTSGETHRQQQQGNQGQYRQQPQQKQQGAQEQSGWRRGQSTTPGQEQMPEGRTQENEDSMRRPQNMPDNPR